MTIKVITGPSGEERVFRPQQENRILMAWASDAEAEDQVLGAAAAEVFARVNAGAESLVEVAERHPHLVAKIAGQAG